MEGDRPKPRGKLRFLHVVLDPAQYAAEFRSCGSAQQEGGKDDIYQASS